MKQKLALLAACAALTSTAALADKATAPGHDRACLVTTSGGPSGTITDTKYLPRKAATAQADNQTTFVGTNPIVATKAGCDALDPD